MAARRRVVVGVDDSAGSRLALRWAAEYAAEVGADVVVVHAFPVLPVPVAALPTAGPPAAGLPAAAPDGLPGSAGSWPARSDPRPGLAALDAILAGAFGAQASALPFHRVAEEGPASRVLLRYAEAADLLVVGVGTVAERCVREAACPVVVVRRSRQRARAE